MVGLPWIAWSTGWLGAYRPRRLTCVRSSLHKRVCTLGRVRRLGNATADMTAKAETMPPRLRRDKVLRKALQLTEATWILRTLASPNPARP